MRKRFSILSLLVAVSIFTSACARPTPTPVPEATKAPAAVATAVPEPTKAPAPAATASPTIAPTPTRPLAPTAAPGVASTMVKGGVTLWHSYEAGSAEDAVLAKLIANAQQAFGEAKISVVQVPFSDILNKYQGEVAAGGGPDLFVARNDDLGAWARGKLVLDISDRLAGRLDKVTPAAVAGMKVDGKLYGVPESAKAVALYYNKELLPAPPKTTAEMLQMVRDGKKLTLFLGAYHMFGFSGAFGGKLLDAGNKCIADQGGWAEALQYVLDLKTAGATIESDYGKAETPFRTGKAAMFINGPWALADYKKDLGDKLAVAPIPAGPGGKANPLNWIDGFYVNPNSKNVAGALALALFLTNAESSALYTAEAGHVPIRSDAAPSDPLIAAFAAAAAAGYPQPQSAEFANFWAPFGDMWTMVVEGAQKPADAVKAATEAMNRANKK